MAELRWVLLAVGAAVIVAIWLYGRYAAKPKRRPIDENLIDAVRDDLPELNDVMEPGLRREDIEALRGMRATNAPVTDEYIVQLHVKARTPVSGTELFPALIDAGLSFGRMDIFHHLDDSEGEVFSVANMVEPGSFDPLHPETLIETPGVSLFAVLPGPLPGGATLERMLSSARGLADALDGEVLDETRSAMTKQTEAHLRERVAEYEARQRARARDA
ncbi:MAG: cell division protein ZipA C-terminal FtsZ-binding domain-containing protein [Gammaproteobacteria bacterium]